MSEHEIKRPEEKPSAISMWKNKLAKHEEQKEGFLSNVGTKLSSSTGAKKKKSLIGMLSPPKSPLGAQGSSIPRIVYILLDISGSMAGADLKFAKTGAHEFSSSAIKKGYRVGLIPFESEAEVKQHATENIGLLSSKIHSLSSQGGTEMLKAIRLGIQELRDQRGLRVLYVVTDGYTTDRERTIEEATRAKKMGIEIICLGTESADHKLLQTIATRTDLAQETASVDLSEAMKKLGSILPSSGSTLNISYDSESWSKVKVTSGAQ